MKLIFISGPSGSGKTTLSNNILEKVKSGIVLSTDNYYKTGLISKILSKFVIGYFDRNISFNYKLFKKDFNLIVKNKISTKERSYDFKNKKIKYFLKGKTNIKYLIVEGIFAKRVSRTIFKDKIFLLELKGKKDECMKRVVQRDLKERGKEKKQAENDFLKSWNIYYESFDIKDKNKNKNANEITVINNPNIDLLLKKIFT